MISHLYFFNIGIYTSNTQMFNENAYSGHIERSFYAARDHILGAMVF